MKLFGINSNSCSCNICIEYNKCIANSTGLALCLSMILILIPWQFKFSNLGNLDLPGIDFGVNEIFSISQLCVAHNASFDRAFLDRYLDGSKTKVWACSINDINWIERGFTNKKTGQVLQMDIIFINKNEF